MELEREPVLWVWIVGKPTDLPCLSSSQAIRIRKARGWEDHFAYQVTQVNICLDLNVQIQHLTPGLRGNRRNLFLRGIGNGARRKVDWLRIRAVVNVGAVSLRVPAGFAVVLGFLKQLHRLLLVARH